MADHCSFCDTRRPAGGTKILVLNGGEFWAEFCPACAGAELVNAETGETVTVGELFDLTALGESVGDIQDPGDVEPDDWDDYGPDNYLDDGEALASAGMGTDEDYGYFGGDDF